MDAPRQLPRPSWRDQPGHLRCIFETPHVVLDDLSEQYGPVCGLYAGPQVPGDVPAPAGMVVNRPTGGTPMRVEPRRRADETIPTGSGDGAVGPSSR